MDWFDADFTTKVSLIGLFYSIFVVKFGER
jgi:hypothetical protein